MIDDYNLCIIKPNQSAFSETFIQAHINGLAGNKKILYGGAFPVYDHEDKFLIRSLWGLTSYTIQKRLFKKLSIGVRTNALVRYLTRENINVVLAEYGMVGAMVSQACRLANVPLVIHFHGADAYHQHTLAKYQELYHEMFKYGSAFVVVSSDMMERLKFLGAPAEKVILNPYGVDTTLFTKVNVNNSKPNFLSIGRFVEKKSPLSVVEAFSILSKNIADVHLWMVGDGPLLASAKELAGQLNLSDKITFTGVLSKNEIQALMQRIRCFVQHSVTSTDGDMEGTPNAILEASSSALPIVSTLHAGIKEAVVHGQTGYLVPEHDIKGMAGYMIKIAEDVHLAMKLGMAGRNHMLKSYNIKKSIPNLDNIIRKSIKYK